jgi:hypothetical protein
MRATTYLAAIFLICTTSGALQAKSAHSTSIEIKGTTWLFTNKAGTRVRASIDRNGNYIDQSVAGKHLDHGTALMKDGKACFTSAMNKDGEICWTMRAVKIGHSMVTTNNRGEKLRATRVKYTPLGMPK